eukprot:gene23351-31687_t
MKTIPFENLDVVGRNIISTNLNDLEAKLVKSHRGGYCFEQNSLLLEVLREIGFKVKPVLVRVRWNKGNIQTPYTHMGLVITLNNDTESAVNYFVDVAFGGLSSTKPLLLPQKDQTSITQESAEFGHSRLVRDDSDMECFTEQWLLKGSWVDLYKFSDREAMQCDLDVANWYSCTHPEARWKGCLFAALIIGSERHHLLNCEYCIRHTDGTATRRKLESVEEVLHLLSTVFGISLTSESAEAGQIQPELIAYAKGFFDKGAPATFHSPFYITEPALDLK